MAVTGQPVSFLYQRRPPQTHRPRSEGQGRRPAKATIGMETAEQLFWDDYRIAVIFPGDIGSKATLAAVWARLVPAAPIICCRRRSETFLYRRAACERVHSCPCGRIRMRHFHPARLQGGALSRCLRWHEPGIGIALALRRPIGDRRSGTDRDLRYDASGCGRGRGRHCSRPTVDYRRYEARPTSGSAGLTPWPRNSASLRP